MSALFKVTTGYKKGASDGSDVFGWADYRVVAKSADEAIQKAKLKWVKEEFLEGVKLVAQIDVL